MIIVCSTAFGCRSYNSENGSRNEKRRISIEVNTMYAGDEYGEIFFNAVKEWEQLTGYEVRTTSNTSDEVYKKRILLDFQTGAEPDVLFYFNGVDSKPLVQNKRVISIDEIRTVYPEYAANMKESLMRASNYDGRIYAVPVNGYWEGLYVNLKVLRELGLDMPDKDTTWDEFLALCEKIKNAGKIPVAAALSEIPHYWFEYCIYNHQSADNHELVPEFLVDKTAQAWIDGLNDLKYMFDKGYFPDDCLYISDEVSKSMFLSGEAAFLLEGSWYASTVNDRVDSSDFAVTYVPGTDTRKTTDIIGGLSTGYFLTKKAWENEEKREAAVSFIEYMTSDEMVSKFAFITATALKEGIEYTGESSAFLESAFDFVEGATGCAEAVQDLLSAERRAPVFENMQGLMTGKDPIDEAVRQIIAMKKK